VVRERFYPLPGKQSNSFIRQVRRSYRASLQKLRPQSVAFITLGTVFIDGLAKKTEQAGPQELL
jgi:hypothetical protein